MKRVFKITFGTLIFVFCIYNIAFADINIPDSPKIIARDEWGADEEYLYDDSVSKPISQNGEIFEQTEKSEDNETAEEIERVIEDNGFGRPYKWPVQVAKKIRFIVIHHTGSAKNIDNPAQAMRNLYHYHAVSRNWGDIGYHYVIDINGNIYQGRQGGDKTIGGHARNLNKTSIGIAVMGDYDKREVSAPALRSLLALTSFLAKKYSINPSGSSVYKEKTYININGHKDSNPTSCPGKYLDQKLFGIRRILAYEQAKKNSEDFDDFEKRDIIIMPPEFEKTFKIRLKNTSSKTWPEKTFLKTTDGILGMEEIFFADTKKSAFALAHLKNAPVAPGETGIFEGKIKTTLYSALYVLSLKLALPNEDLSENSLLLPVFAEGLDTSYELVEKQDPKRNLFPGEEASGYIKLKNNGNFTWKKSGLGSVKIAAISPAGRKSPFFNSQNIIAELKEAEVKPGGIGTFEFKAKAPEKTGRYIEHFAPIAEILQPFDDKNLFFEFEVKQLTDIPKNLGPIRIKLNFLKSPIVRYKGMTDLFDGDKLLRTFPKNTVFRIIEGKENTWKIMTKHGAYTADSYVKIKPKAKSLFEIINKTNDNEFRGAVETRKIDGKLTVINELPIEDYLKGVAEAVNNTPIEKTKALSILARTYAMYYMTKAEKFPGKPYHLDDDPKNTQKYLGLSFEKRAPNVVKAVKETKGQIVIYEGKLVKTPYFSQSDGRTRGAEEVWGWKNAPYLISVPDPACKGPLKGHGVGLSGCGADAMARQGKTAEEIIKYYYKGVEIYGKN